MKITIELLNNMPSGRTACSDAQLWLKNAFPAGGELEEVWNACTNTDWKIWFTANYLQAEDLQALAWKFAGQAMRFAGITEFADNVNAENWQEARKAARSAAADAAAAYADAYADAYAAAYADADAYADAYAAAYADAAAYAAADAARTEQLEWCLAALTAITEKTHEENNT